MVVVLPDPLTPTIKITKGLFSLKVIGFIFCDKISFIRLFNCSKTSSFSRIRFFATSFFKSSRINEAEFIPTSAIRRISSNSSNNSGPTFALPCTTFSIPPARLERVFCKPDLSRAKNPDLGSSFGI